MRCEHEEYDHECNECIEEFKSRAIEAGIPLSVIEGKTKLSDHFSQDYINEQCGRTNDDE